MNKSIKKLLMLNDIQERVVGILLSRGLVKIKDSKSSKKYTNISITSSGANAIKSEVELPLTFINEYRQLFPPRKKSSAVEVQDKLTLLYHEIGGNIVQFSSVVLKATSRYIDQLDDPTYCEKAGNFISRELKGSVTRSTLKEYIELNEDDSNETTKSNLGFGNELI